MCAKIHDPELDLAIQKTHCDWLAEQAKMLKTMLDYRVHQVPANKTRALSTISTIQDSINEMRLYFESL